MYEVGNYAPVIGVSCVLGTRMGIFSANRRLCTYFVAKLVNVEQATRVRLF